jgi:hypothetical protein
LARSDRKNFSITLRGDKDRGRDAYPRPPRTRKPGDKVTGFGKINDNPNHHFGYNAATNQYEDLVAAGVIDPTKVTRTALQNAASIAAPMLTTEGMVADIPEPKQSAAGGGHGGGGGMGDM